MPGASKRRARCDLFDVPQRHRGSADIVMRGDVIRGLRAIPVPRASRKRTDTPKNRPHRSSHIALRYVPPMEKDYIPNSPPLSALRRTFARNWPAAATRSGNQPAARRHPQWLGRRVNAQVSPHLDDLAQISEALGVSVTELLRESAWRVPGEMAFTEDDDEAGGVVHRCRERRRSVVRRASCLDCSASGSGSGFVVTAVARWWRTTTPHHPHRPIPLDRP